MISYLHNVVAINNSFNNIFFPSLKNRRRWTRLGLHGQLSNAKLDLTGLWDLAKQEDPVLASPSAQSGEPDGLVLTIINTYLTSYPQTDQQHFDCIFMLFFPSLLPHVTALRRS